MILRREQPDDRAAIFTVHCAAFARPGGEVPPEAPLVDDLRTAGDIVAGLSIVALSDDVIVGHVVCSRARIGSAPVVGVGPLGVHPDHQRSGVGSALMHAVVAAADALDEPVIVLLGDPGYYARFGFDLAPELGVRPPDPAWAPFFQLRRLANWGSGLRGDFRYADAFDGV